MYRIVETCVGCDLCVDQCPIGAIAAAEPVYVIDDTCCDFEECLVVCPVEAIVPVAEEQEDE